MAHQPITTLAEWSAVARAEYPPAHWPLTETQPLIVMRLDRPYFATLASVLIEFAGFEGEWPGVDGTPEDADADV